MEPNGKLGAIVLAAGQSTRFRSATSKLLHVLHGRPVICWTLAALRDLEAEPIVVVVGAHAEAVQAACGPGAQFVLQPEQRGTGHAALMARSALEHFSGAVLVLNADLPMLTSGSLRRLVEQHHASGAGLTVMTATVPEPHGWGRIVRHGGAIHAIVEERDATRDERALREVNVGVYCIGPRLVFPILERLTPDNVQGEMYLTDMVKGAVQAGIRVAGVPVEAKEVVQVNSRVDLAAVGKTMRERTNRAWMAAGVTLEDPDSTYIGPDVRVGRDTVIGPNVHLRGRTVVGESCRFDGSAFVTDSAVADGVHVKFGVVMTETEIGRGCEIGPFAHLRPGTCLAAAVHIGDFVETKKAVIGEGTKANHLAYLGDVEIGSDTNIGAGTITCNYDGFRKHRTVIGSRVQVGSDSQLVAPVTVADDAYVATGTTVRQNVPAGALVFNSKQDIHRPGWVAARRAREAGTAGLGAQAAAVRPRPLRAVAKSKGGGVRTKRAKAGVKPRATAGTKKAARVKTRGIGRSRRVRTR
ncbi:MAG: UDP-N-acetylglucosamine diphosphorylase/glucosamine-1-phosphate N-acetyltransferase [Acidobacteria bacterium RBG_16_68_9]|nr:MAG: UDP-N-acetylglucosamine diphosphorylase/glucosamine-1-phosphate N-acetyltransferase [Acidobacteria bacterium RBG_16_68_9]